MRHSGNHAAFIWSVADLLRVNDVFPGGTVTANDCFQIQTADAGSLVGYWNGLLEPIGPYFSLR